MTDWAAEGAELVEAESAKECSRCPDVACELWRWPDGKPQLAGYEWYVCPCCKSRIRTPEQIERGAAVKRAELGMSEAEYSAHCRSFIDPTPLSTEALAGLRKTIEKNEAEWTPACEHDTQNPWAKS